MNKKLVRVLVGSLLALAALGMVGCEMLLEEILAAGQPTGRVIDAKTGEGVSGVALTLTYVSGLDKSQGPFTGTTGTDGTFRIGSDVPYARYELTGSKSGYAFIPVTVDLNESTLAIGDMMGFEYQADKQGQDVSFILTWSDAFDDVDLYFTYPTETAVNATYAFTDPYTIPGLAPTGFVPVFGAATNRQAIYHGRPNPSAFDFTYGTGALDSYRVELDVDARQGRGPETVTLRQIPYNYMDADASSTTGGANTGLPALSSGFYSWVGSAAVYAHAYGGTYPNADPNASLGDGTNGADAILYVLQGSTVLGKYTVPSFTDIRTSSLVRVNMFYKDSTNDYAGYIQIVPDIRLVTGGSTRISTIDAPSVINIPVRGRR